VSAARPRPSAVRQFTALVGKDLRLELRTRHTLVAMLLFAALLMCLFQFGFGSRVSDLDTPDGLPAQVADITPFTGGILWATVALTAVLAVGRAWVAEREQRVLDVVLSAPVSRSALMAAKAVSLFLYLVAVEALAVPMTWLFFVRDADPLAVPLTIAVCLLANLSIAILGSMVSALALFSRARELMVPVLFLPSLVPVVIAAAGATYAATLGTNGLAEYRGYSLFLGVYALIFGLVAFAIYDHVFDD
jgi:heme exporter protein B